MKLLKMMCTASLLAGCTAAPYVETQVNELYDRMTQEERIAQLCSMYMDELFDDDGRLDTVKCRKLIPNGIGHFSQFCLQQPRDPNEIRDRVAAVQEWLIHNTPNGIPALMHEEVLSGINTRGATIYPQQIGQACSFNTELAELKTKQTATALRKMGGVLSLSPMVDVCRTPSFNRLEESYGEDAYLSAAMGVAFVRGLQKGDLKKGVGACSKHYLGYGGGGDAEEKELMEEILMPHEAMIRVAGSRALMPGYHAMPNTEIYEPMCYNNPSPRKVHPTLNAAGPLFATPNTQWPFGYGLSYTNFEYSNLRLACPQQLSNDSFITLSFDVKNTGKMMADEIAQIYISPTDDNQEIRRIQLQGFARVSLKPGETKKVEVKFFTELFGFYKNVNGNHSWNVKPGTYAIKIGASSVDFRLEEQITLTGKPVHKPLREFYFSETSLK